MATVTPLAQSAAEPPLQEPVRLIAEVREFWRQFFVAAFSPYRPELHYMRGPGPAWHAKHGHGRQHGD
uniref:Uncharacterized protein n=1 Tax=Rhodopseudomonas palustris (strain BisA53) TaxID=316055 RepID=Q07Q02_RHOP5